MNFGPKKLYFVLIGCVGLSLAVLLGSAYAANSFLAGKSQSVVQARTKVMVAEEKQRQLTKAKADIEKYRDLADIAKSIVPQDKDQARTVREIVTIAGNHSIKLGAIAFPTSSLGDNKTPHSQLLPVKTISGVYSLDITVQSDTASPASFNNFIAFLDALEHNRRTALVTGITISPDALNPSKLTFSLTLQEYIKP